MAIHSPSGRLLRFVPLAFIRRRAGGDGRRPNDASLNTTSMIDFLLTVVVFLLMSFSASNECCLVKPLTMPRAENTIDMIDAPVVAVYRDHILIDGTPAGSTREIEETGHLTRLDELRNIMRSKRELWRAVNAEKPFPGVCVLQVDQDTSAIVLKSVVNTVSGAGYPNLSFQVNQLPRKTRG